MGASRPHNPAVWGELGGALPRPQDTEPKQQQKTDLKHKESDSPVCSVMIGALFDLSTFSIQLWPDAFNHQSS
jgi:hypothetical protein